MKRNLIATAVCFERSALSKSAYLSRFPQGEHVLLIDPMGNPDA